MSGDPMRSLAELDRSKVHPLVRESAEWAWRLVLLAAAAYVLVEVFNRFEEVLVPVALAILGSAFLVPIVDWLDRRRCPRSLAVVVTIVCALGVLSAVMTFVVREFINGVPELSRQVTVTIDRTRNWLVNGPIGVDEDQVRRIGDDVVDFVQHNQDKLTTGALSTATTVTEILTGGLLTVFLLIFFLYGGGQIWAFCTRIIPSGTRDRVCEAGVAGFGTLVGYVRATVAVAFVDACGIGVGLAILGVPLALPLASLVFLGAFIPIVGALITGSLAVMVALVTQGWIAAVISLAIVVGVMQLESHVLQPFLLGRSVRLHPVAVVLAIAAGIVSAGIVGGLLAVPLIAFGNTAVRYMLGHPQAPEPESASQAQDDDDSGMFIAQPDEPVWDDAANIRQAPHDPPRLVGADDASQPEPSEAEESEPEESEPADDGESDGGDRDRDGR